MSNKPEDVSDDERPGHTGRPMRADAQRNIEALLAAAKDVFAQSGVDAPVRDIAAAAGVGVGTLYRHFPQRADLIAAVFRREVDACADAAPILAAQFPPIDALVQWMAHYSAFIATKRGLASALHSGDVAFETLPGYFESRLVPALRSLLDAAAEAGTVRGDVDPYELLGAIARLFIAARDDRPGQADRMVALLIDGLRYGAHQSGDGTS